MRIAPETIDQVRTSNDIVDVIGAHVRLRKRGKHFIGLCPFHQEKTPSFSVSREKQMYYCFGCGKGGNVFTFVMETEKVSFVESIRTLAERVGITISADTVQADQTSEIEQLYNLTRMAGLFFHDNLFSSEGRNSLEYFRQRGFSDDTIRTFGLGYSLDSWDGFLTYARKQGAKDEHLLRAGLVRKRDDGSFYDYFRGRAMFPILSTAGRVIGFGARKIRPDDPIEGKYINSPETPIYNKSRTLYGFSHSKDAIRSEDRALMVEGYADLISLFQAGVQHVVASSGTALTTEQLQVLGRYTKNLTLVYDADSAGSNATLRGVDLALEQDFDIRVAELPKGDDPDSFVRAHGRQEFHELLSRSVSFIDFNMEKLRGEGLLTSPEGQARAVRSVIQSIAKIPDELKRNFYIKEIAQKYNLYESVLYRELENTIGKERKSAPRFSRSFESATAEMPIPAESEIALLSVPAPQKDVLKLLLEGSPEIVKYLLDSVMLDDFIDDRMKQLVERIFDMLQEGSPLDVASFVDSLESSALKMLVADIVMSRYELSKGWQELEVEIDEADPWEIAKAAVTRLKKERVTREIEQNQKGLKEATQRGDDAMPFIVRHQELLKQMREVDQEASASQSEAV